MTIYRCLRLQSVEERAAIPVFRTGVGMIRNGAGFQARQSCPKFSSRSRKQVPESTRSPKDDLWNPEMTIYRLVEQGAIPHFRVGGLIRFDPQAIADWLRRKMPLNQTAA